MWTQNEFPEAFLPAPCQQYRACDIVAARPNWGGQIQTMHVMQFKSQRSLSN
uniref:Uncharacterized protein n=1 Tax=Anguilla anguilla TaxID=7936 RepID=A0A0E9PGR3_ANGAN